MNKIPHDDPPASSKIKSKDSFEKGWLKEEG